MKDYCRIIEYEFGKGYLNKNNQYHRLTGPAVKWENEDKNYWINHIHYMDFYKNINELYIFTEILELNSEYEKYIKQNIKDLIQEYNPKIELLYFEKEQIKQLPNWLKNLIII